MENVGYHKREKRSTRLEPRGTNSGGRSRKTKGFEITETRHRNEYQGSHPMLIEFITQFDCMQIT
ncbi:ETS domain-containing Elk-4 [Gossypium arboreum]|uniref:ETS domain-containing Elk-4 n=1 Tax=Gossypium arboreum TaxID=29729 RepID=A0A0B0NMM9_GOSAR|nr:ETS domain-containing Elk-4 [Gossypium arboreum]